MHYNCGDNEEVLDQFRMRWSSLLALKREPQTEQSSLETILCQLNFSTYKLINI